MKKKVLFSFLALVLFLFHAEAQVRDSMKVFVATSPMPMFPGGEQALMKYINDNLTYPQDALDAGMQGQVVVQFAIDTSGKVVNTRIKEGLSHSCDSVVLTIVRSMPNWIPVNKNRISDIFTLPIHFKLPYDYKLVNGEKIYTTCEQMPMFPGGEKNMFRFIADNLKWPLFEYEGSHFQGRVIIRFIVTEEGKITNIKVIKGIDQGLDKEAIRVVESMPDWTPAKIEGKNVKCYYTLPVVFRLM